MTKEIYFYPLLVKAAKDLGFTVSFQRHWYIFNDHNPRGGYVDPKFARDLLISACGISRSQAYAVLKMGNGVYWNYKQGTSSKNRGTLRIYTLHELCAKLGLTSPGLYLKRPISDLADPLFAAQTWVICGVHVGSLFTPMTREQLAEVTGFPPRTQVRHNKRLGIKCNREVLVELFTDNFDEVVECMRMNSDCYRGYFYIDGMDHAMYAVLRQIGSSFEGQQWLESPEVKIQRLGTRRGTGLWIKKADLPRLYKLSGKWRTCLAESTCTNSTRRALRADGAACADGNAPCAQPADDWQPPCLGDLEALPPASPRGCCLRR